MHSRALRFYDKGGFTSRRARASAGEGRGGEFRGTKNMGRLSGSYLKSWSVYSSCRVYSVCGSLYRSCSIYSWCGGRPGCSDIMLLVSFGTCSTSVPGGVFASLSILQYLFLWWCDCTKWCQLRQYVRSDGQITSSAECPSRGRIKCQGFRPNVVQAKKCSLTSIAGYRERLLLGKSCARAAIRYFVLFIEYLREKLLIVKSRRWSSGGEGGTAAS